MSGYLVEFAVARGFLFTALVRYSAVLDIERRQ
jgi:hypothetical protein